MDEITFLPLDRVNKQIENFKKLLNEAKSGTYALSYHVVTCNKFDCETPKTYL